MQSCLKGYQRACLKAFPNFSSSWRTATLWFLGDLQLSNPTRGIRAILRKIDTGHYYEDSFSRQLYKTIGEREVLPLGTAHAR